MTAREKAGGRWAVLLGVGLVGLIAACGGGESPGETSTTDHAAMEAGGTVVSSGTVRIVTPEDGAVLEGGPVRVTLEVEGVEIVPAGTDQPGSGHHHLLVNVGLPDPTAPIPSLPPSYVHMGQAQTEYDLELEPGDYEVIAVVGDWAHVPLQPWVVDTVRFTVR